MSRSTGVGARIRRLRAERDLTQGEFASDIGVSPSYLSLIESEKRPVPDALLAAIAERFGCAVSYLRSGSGSARDSREMELAFAEMALAMGELPAAQDRFDTLLDTADAEVEPDDHARARWGRARVREKQGLLEDAIADYEALLALATLPGDVERLPIATALCRAYDECGDLNRAIDVAERALADADGAGSPPPVEQSVAMVSTLVGCYYERGDLVRAQALATQAIATADQAGSPQSRASAHWNAALVAEARGDVSTARTFVTRALALFREVENARAVALLKITASWLDLRAPEPDLEATRRQLAQAIEELDTIGADHDIAYAETELARCALLDGDPVEAIRIAELSLVRLGSEPRLEAARARLVIGHARLDLDDLEGALAAYRAATAQLTDSRADRQAATAWRELAEALTAVGRDEEALQAYREAADAAGVTRPPGRRTGSRTALRRA